MISVILTTYQRRRLLARALASVFAQTLTDHEVIAVDDGSTDGTAEFLATQPVSCVRIAHSGNPAIARNAGLKRAQGDLIAFLDSDDRWQPTALAEMAEALGRHPDAGFAYCDDHVRSALLPESAGVADIFDALLTADFLLTGGVLIRSSVAVATGEFDPLCSPAEDWDYWLRLAALALAVHVPASLIVIDSAPDSLSRAPGGTIHGANIRVMQKAVGWCAANRPASVPLARRSLRRQLLASARYHWHRRAFARSMRDLAMVGHGR